MKKILVVDDESSILRIIKHSLEKSGYSVVCYDNLLELRLNELNAYDLLILDVMLPKMNGF
jgi:DNA-binding response OmpR family regulator